LDNYTADLEGAYALALLDSTYTGDCIRVRRASDNTEQDIGFDGQYLDTNALTTFCTGTDCFVKTWYDQSGNANDATQSTAANQPKIYDSNTGVELENAVEALRWNGSSTFLRNSAITTSGAHTIFSVNKYTDEANENVLYDSDTSPQTIAYINALDSWVIQYGGTFNTSYTADESQHLHTFLINAASSNFYEDGTSVATGNPGANNMSGLTIGATRVNAVPWNGTIQAFIIYSADKSSDRTAIESALNDYFNVY